MDLGGYFHFVNKICIFSSSSPFNSGVKQTNRGIGLVLTVVFVQGGMDMTSKEQGGGVVWSGGMYNSHHFVDKIRRNGLVLTVFFMQGGLGWVRIMYYFHHFVDNIDVTVWF